MPPFPYLLQRSVGCMEPDASCTDELCLRALAQQAVVKTFILVLGEPWNAPGEHIMSREPFIQWHDVGVPFRFDETVALRARFTVIQTPTMQPS